MWCEAKSETIVVSVPQSASVVWSDGLVVKALDF